MHLIENSASRAFDLAVIGGGPAGTSAAITAARTGARVLLLERGRLPRQRVCGEFVSSESLTLLAGLLEQTAPDLLRQAIRIPEARLFFDGRALAAPVDPPAASIARFDLDFALWQAAEQCGVVTRTEMAVERIVRDDFFHLTTNAGEAQNMPPKNKFRARAVINATGRWSNLRRQSLAEESNSTKKWLGLKAHFSEPAPNPSVDLYFFEGGYCGVQPVTVADNASSTGRINACAMVRSDVARSLKEVFAQQPQLAERALHWQPLTEVVSTSPLIFRDPEPVDNGILLAGDAAGFLDPFVGDGISLALRSGALAAECLMPFLSSHGSLAAAASQYQRQYRERLLPVFRNSSKLRRLLGLPRLVRRAVGHLLETTPAVSRLLVRLTR
jgi:flavin-dependent dehydrogenase